MRQPHPVRQPLIVRQSHLKGGQPYCVRQLHLVRKFLPEEGLFQHLPRFAGDTPTPNGSSLWLMVPHRHACGACDYFRVWMHTAKNRVKLVIIYQYFL